jgi:DNA polymerase elongation subunit (family B)
LALVRCLLEDRAAALPALHAEFAQGIRSKSWPIQRFAKTEALQDSLAAYRKKIESTSRNRAAAFEVALRSGRDYQAGDSISYYITGQKKKVTAYDHARPVADWSAEARDENVEYYAAKLDELYEKFSTFAKGAAEQQGAFGF